MEANKEANKEYYLLRNGKRVMIYFNKYENQLYDKKLSTDKTKIFVLKELNENFNLVEKNIEICFLEYYKDTILHYWPEIFDFILNNKDSRVTNIYKNNDIKLYKLSGESMDYIIKSNNIFCLCSNIYMEILERSKPKEIKWEKSNYNINNIFDFLNNKLYTKYIYNYLVKSIKIHPDYYTDSQIGFVIYNEVYFKFNTYKMGKILEL